MMDGDGNIVTTPRNFRLNVYSPIECPPGIQKYFPDPYDCSAYHYCSGKFPYLPLKYTDDVALRWYR